MNCQKFHFPSILRRFNSNRSLNTFIKPKLMVIQTRKIFEPKQPGQSLIYKLPTSIVPYARLLRMDKPAGTWLLFLPGAWSIVMSAKYGHVDFYTTLHMVSLFGIGSVLLRGSGCIINDMWDRNLDKQVERTKMRPLASGELTLTQAFTCLSLHLSAGLVILMQLNIPSIILGASSLIFVTAYPLMKRITYWPQAFLGLTFNWGALLGNCAILGYLHLPIALPLYIAGVFWTLVYDTIYALQDINDDLKVGIKSSAIRVADNAKFWLMAFSTASVTNLAIAGYFGGQGPVFYTISVLGTAIHYIWQIKTLNLNSVNDAASKFKSNIQLGLIIFAGILLDNGLSIEW